MTGPGTTRTGKADPTDERKIATFLWFDGAAEEAASSYVSLFQNARIVHVARNGEAGPAAAGTAMMVTFEIEGQRFMALNGGPQFQFNEAISLFIECEDQAEVDRLWEGLIAGGGAPSQCGWLKDRFGLSWQIVPTALGELMQDDDPERAGRVREAMMTMQKLDVARLEEAYREASPAGRAVAGARPVDGHEGR